MLEKLLSNRRLIAYVLAAIISLLLIIGYFANGSDQKETVVRTTTTTTTLPAKDAQACEYLTPTSLLAGGLIPDVDPKTTDNKKRCTYENIGGDVNYITLYVDTFENCQILIDDAKNPEKVSEISPNAIITTETDPTIIVPQGSRCFFLQASRTLISDDKLIAIGVEISRLFIAVDATTTTSTSTTVVLPEVGQPTLPGQNTAPTTTVPSG